MDTKNRGLNLEKLAAIFRDEGDAETATAIERQLSSANADSTEMQAKQWKSMRQAVRLTRRGRQLDQKGDHDQAAPLLEQALAIKTQVLGIDSEEVEDCMLYLARCKLNGCRFLEALNLYTQLYHRFERTVGPNDMLTTVAAEHMLECQERQKNAEGALRLQKQMAKVINLSDENTLEENALEENAYAERAYAIAMRLMKRKQYAKAVAPFKLWLDFRMSHADADYQDMHLILWRYGRMLLAAKRPMDAVRTFQFLVVIANKRVNQKDKSLKLLRALNELRAGLEMAGMHKAAAETKAMLNRLQIRENLSGLKARARGRLR